MPVDTLFQNFGICLDGILVDVRTMILAGLTIMFILIGFSLILNVFNIGGSMGKGILGRSRNDDSDQ